MDAARKKELKKSYQSKPVVGGICCIRCRDNQHRSVLATTNLAGLKNRFDFSMSMKTSPDPTMYDEWLKYGSESFEFTVLEEIVKREDQTDVEFARDIDELYALWCENHNEDTKA